MRGSFLEHILLSLIGKSVNHIELLPQENLIISFDNHLFYKIKNEAMSNSPEVHHKNPQNKFYI